LDVIEHHPERLTEVPGLGPKRTRMIADAWEEQKIIKEVMIFLQGVGVSTSIAVRIFKQYGERSVEVVRTQPYRLADDVWGIGFKTADTIAQAVGIPHDSPERVKAGLRYTLSQAADDGHCYLPAPNLTADAVKILDVPAPLTAACLDELAADHDDGGNGGVVREQVPAGDTHVPAVYLPPFHPAEQSLAGSPRPASTSWPQTTATAATGGWHANRSPPAARTSPPATCRPSTAPRSPSPAPCSPSCTPAATGSTDSPTSTGRKPHPGRAS